MSILFLSSYYKDKEITFFRNYLTEKFIKELLFNLLSELSKILVVDHF